MEQAQNHEILRLRSVEICQNPKSVKRQKLIPNSLKNNAKACRPAFVLTPSIKHVEHSQHIIHQNVQNLSPKPKETFIDWHQNLA